MADVEAAAVRRWRVRFRVTSRAGRAADGISIVAERAIVLPEGWSVLTRRERQVALMLCAGLRRTEIGNRLGVSLRTIDSHRTAIMVKLRMRNEVELLLSVLEWPMGVVHEDAPCVAHGAFGSWPRVAGPAVIVERDDGMPIIDEGCDA